MQTPSLSLVLTLNAITSGVVGLITLLVPTVIAGLFGEVPAWVCQLVGAGLLIFGLGVGYIVWKLPQSWHLTRWILMLDIAWLVATPIVMLVFARNLSLLGHILLVLTAGIVLWYAWWEAYWLKNSPASVPA